LFVPLALDEDVQDVVVLIHRAPQRVALTVHGQQDCIHVPFFSGLRATAPQPLGVVLANLPTPWAGRFVG